MSRQVAVVTGGSSGIGFAIARSLVLQGYDVAIAARDQEKLDRAAKELRALKAGAQALGFSIDVSDPNACQALILDVVQVFDRIDVLVNNAGYADVASIDQTSPDMWRRMIDINASSVAYLTHAVWPVFSSQNSGFVINISSMAAKDPFPGFFAYAASKAAVNMLTQVTANEGKRIKVNAVGLAPGAVETPLLRSMFDEKMVPGSMALKPEDLADLAMACLSGEKAFKPGETIYITK